VTFFVEHGSHARSLVLHERGWRRYESHSANGALSIKCMFGGAAIYETRLGRYRVSDGAYLVLNHGTGYRIAIDEPRPMESFCIFLAPGLIEATLRARTASPDRILSEPTDTRAPAVELFERTYPHDGTLTPLLMNLRRASMGGDCEHAWWEEQLHACAARLLVVDRGAQCEVARIAALRRSTRQELYRRLHRARDYMEASVGERLGLERIARVAAMAPHHFLRTFKQLFGATPHQYLVARRMERARDLLARSDVPVTQIGLDVGFDSAGAFSGAFRRRVGVSPQAYRRQRRR
jgi:AraC family transcriptional regulator